MTIKAIPEKCLWNEIHVPDISHVVDSEDCDEFDVLIIGAGYSGLWTAFYLHLNDTSLRIAIIEKNSVGFGASGRVGKDVHRLFRGDVSHRRRSENVFRRAVHPVPRRPGWKKAAGVGRRHRPSGQTVRQDDRPLSAGRVHAGDLTEGRYRGQHCRVSHGRWSRACQPAESAATRLTRT